MSLKNKTPNPLYSIIQDGYLPMDLNYFNPHEPPTKEESIDELKTLLANNLVGKLTEEELIKIWREAQLEYIKDE